MRRTLNAILGLALLLCVTNPARAQVRLENKFPAGAKSTLVTKIETQQVLKIAGMDVETAATQTRTIELTNGTRAADGSIRVNQAVTGLQAELTIAGVDLEFDSAEPDAPPPGTPFDMLLEILKAAASASWTLVHDKDNRVVKVEGGEEALASLEGQTRDMVAKQFDAEYLKDQANTQLDLLPTTPVSKGESWERSSSVRLEAGQIMEFDTAYQYKGTVARAGRQLDEITATVTAVRYSVDDDAQLKITASELEVADSEGTILFDRQAGTIVHHKSMVHITGTITFVGPAGDLPGELDLTMRSDTTRKES